MTLKRCCILVGKLKDQGNVFIYLPLLDHIEHFDAEFFTLNGIQFNIVARFATKDHNEILWHKDFFSGLGLHRWIGPKLFFPIQKIILGQTTRPTFITPSLPSQFHHFSKWHKPASSKFSWCQSRKLPPCWLHLIGTTTGCRRRWRSAPSPAPCCSTQGRRWKIAAHHQIGLDRQLIFRFVTAETATAGRRGRTERQLGRTIWSWRSREWRWVTNDQPTKQPASQPPPPSKHFL